MLLARLSAAMGAAVLLTDAAYEKMGQIYFIGISATRAVVLRSVLATIFVAHPRGGNAYDSSVCAP